MPKIEIEFSIPEQPDRNVVTVTIEGPDQRQVARAALSTIEHYTSGAVLCGTDLRFPGERTVL
jgi:hypothetical protein